MDVATLYALRSAPKIPLSSVTTDAIAKMRLTAMTYRPSAHVHHGKRSYHRRTPTAPALPDNWRQKAMMEVHRRVKEREDPDYDVVVESVNKLSKEHFKTFVEETLAVLKKRDHVFRLRVSTLLFDRGVQQNFFAPLIASFIQVLAREHEGVHEDILTQVEMFDMLYDASKVILVPSSSDPTYDDTIIAWTKQKEKKRGFAVLVGELYNVGIIPLPTMELLLRSIAHDLEASAAQMKDPCVEEHVDHLGRFVFAVAPNLKGGLPLFVNKIREILGMPRPSMQCLNMKTRFKLEDALKLLKSPSA